MTREETILKLIVEHFIKTAQPVGSQTLLEEYHLPYSSATIRAEMNALESRITVMNEDLRELKGKLNFGFFDVVVCNPPYKPLGTGIVSSGKSHSIVRHENTCTIEDVIKTASSLLRFGGRFCMCLRPDRLTESLMLMRKYLIEPKRLRMVQQRKDKAPKLFLVEGKRGGKEGGLNVMPVLLIEDESGNFSEEMMKIYGSFKEVK